MIKINRFRKGFTLIELLIYMGLVAIFLGILTNLFISVLDLKNESLATSAVESDGRFILQRLIYDTGQEGTDSIIADYSLVGDKLVRDGSNLNSSETSISNFETTPLGNLGGKQSLQVKFTVSSIRSDISGGEQREYQITLGSR